MGMKQNISQRARKHKDVNRLPKQVTEKEFEQFFLPYLSLPKRGKKAKIPLWRIFNYILHQLHTGCQWENVPIKIDLLTGKRELSHTSVWKWFNRWANDGSFEQAFVASVRTLQKEKKLNLTRIHGDGTNSIAKKGATTSAIQGINIRKDKRQ